LISKLCVKSRRSGVVQFNRSKNGDELSADELDRPKRLGAEHLPLRDKVAEKIRAMILSTELKPGERLVEDWLAEELGVSRNPIREAIRMLASEGLVEVTARRGATVASLSPKEAEDLIEVRATLEAANARLAAKRRSSADVEVLKDALRRGHLAVETGQTDQLLSLNDEFHSLLARAGANRALFDLMNTVRDRTKPLFRNFGIGFARTSWDEHAEILQAIIDGDSELAPLLAYRHVINASRPTP
jgi:DNA-binding GntR family transcriptional regulator